MGDNYNLYIEKIIPTTFNNIYVVDMINDLVLEYTFDGNKFNCSSERPFTTFYSEIEREIHPDDIKGYVDNITANNLEGKDFIRYEYRQKDHDNNYNWYENITKLIKINDRRVVLVLVENISESKSKNENNDLDISNFKTKQKFIIDTISNAVINLNNIVNINCSNENIEVKSIIDYINNIILDLTNNFPELNEALTENMIRLTNQSNTNTIIVVDDDKITCDILAKTFEDKYKILVANNGQEAIDILEENNNMTSLEKKDKIVGIFLDLKMPIVDGFGVLDYLSSKNFITRIPIIIISGDYDEETKNRIYTYPIADVLEKPFNTQVVKHRIKTLIKLYKSNNSLNDMVLNQHQEIKNVLRTLVKSYLYDRSSDIKKIVNYVKILTEQVSEDYSEYALDGMRIEKIVDAVKYYNIGLYTLPHRMFDKQDFNDDEIKIIRSHPYIGLSIFNSVLYRDTDRLFNHYAKDIIEYHEEMYNGEGYPLGLKEDNIPIVAQIASVAIEYNELLKTMNESSVIDELSKKSGTKFNPKIIDSLKRAGDKMRKVNEI